MAASAPRRALLAALALGVCLFSGVPARAQAVDPLTLLSETIRLPNGLTVLLAPDARARVASVEVSYAAGAADDPDGLRGLAHAVEHLLMHRTKHIKDPLRELELAGASRFNAETFLDRTIYFESLPPERLATALWLESDRMGYAADEVTETALDAERAILANEDRDRHVDGTLAAVGPFTMQQLFPEWHPYAGAADSASDLGSIHARDVLAFLRTWYCPSNATLAIAGAFDRDATVEAVKRYFGSLPSGEVPARPRLPEWTTPAVRLVVSAAAQYDSVLVAWRTPAFGTRDDAALDVVATTLVAAGKARFALSLVADHLVTRISARQQSEREASVFLVDARVAPGVAPSRVVAAIQDAINDVAYSVTAAEAEQARGLARLVVTAHLETTWGRAAQLVAMSTVGSRAGPGFDWGLGRYATVGPKEVARAAGSWLTREHRIATLILANRAAPARGVLIESEKDVP